LLFTLQSSWKNELTAWMRTPIVTLFDMDALSA